MKHTRKLTLRLTPCASKLTLCLLLTLAAASFATQARVESMGKRPAFFIDDATMFDNPANATFYSSALMGELGFYNQNTLGTSHVGLSKDPLVPWFGALFKVGLSDQKDMRDPQVTIGGFFGREHSNFTRFVPRKVVISGDTIPIPQSATNFDAFLAGTMLDGSAVGAHVYVGVQDGKQDVDNPSANTAKGDLTPDAHVSILSMDYGVNFLVTNQTSIELTLGAARIQYGPSRKTFLDPGLFSFYSQGRLFTDIDALSGQLVTGYKLADMEVPGWEENLYNLNLGLNVVIPRGFIWVGLDGVRVKEEVGTWDKAGERDDEYLIYREPGSLEQYETDHSDRMGGIVSFGIERNAWNWFVFRFGGQKSFIYNTCRNNTGKATICDSNRPTGQKLSYWSTNPYGDGSLDDHVGIGVGLNIEDKLKIDFSLAEDVFFRNPFRGEGRFISRISSIYTF
jgi:hypothetical protein